MFRRLFLILFLGSLSFACTSEPLGQSCTIAGKEVGPGESIIKAMTCESCRCDEAGPPVCEAIPDCRPTIPDIEDRSGTNEGDDYDPDRDGPRPRDPDRTDEDCASGGLSGTACAPDGTSIAGAVVRARGMDCHGMEILRETQADENGQYAFEALPEGTVTVTLEIGSFSRDFSTDVRAGETADLDTTGADFCLSRDAAKIAVISGVTDRIEGILDDMGFEYDLFCGGAPSNAGARLLLGDWSRLSQYDVVFINCGAVLPLTRASGRIMIDNLRRFVQEGGSLYISDLAAGVITEAWPDSVRFRGILESQPGFDNGRESINPDYAQCCTCTSDCPASCELRPMDTTTNRRGDMCLGAMFSPGEYRPSDFFCPGDMMIGRGPPGQVSARLDSEVLRTALGRDNMNVQFESPGWVQVESVGANTEVLVSGPCCPLMTLYTDPNGGGRVAYTTFHNEAQVSADVQAILRALIFQL